MFLKSLTISSGVEIIREIKFRRGMNLIVDESEEHITGNNVGKTTVLKLIDFCLGANPKNIYMDPETKQKEYQMVRDFLIDKEVLITLVLTSSLDNTREEIKIERNFLSKNKIIRQINGSSYTEKEFNMELLKRLFPSHPPERPTFRQIISHNIRYKDEAINKTLDILPYTKTAEYEALYLFLFGCKFDRSHARQAILEKSKQENYHKSRLEQKQTKTAYEMSLAFIHSKIAELDKQKANFNLNEDFEANLDKLNNLRYQINKASDEIGKLTIRKDLIIEAEQELKATKSDIDFKQLQLIYEQATSQINNIQKTFEELVNYHNRMIIEKIKFIKKELPSLENKIQYKKDFLNKLLSDEKNLSASITKSDSFGELEKIIRELNENYNKKGECENSINLLTEVENNITNYNQQLENIDDELFSDDFQKMIKDQLKKLNQHFASISKQLYGEEYLITCDIVRNKENQRVYKFSTFNNNTSSGKKQGEITCFDIAYILFAEEENISCLHFLLNDKKELMHDNQLVKIAQLVSDYNVQFIASILKDKLPEELNNENFFILKLSQKDKLFKIEA